MDALSIHRTWRDRGMGVTSLPSRGYITAAIVGALGGGILVAIAGKIIPKMMSEMMSGMMSNMMAQMGEEGCEPEEM